MHGKTSNECSGINQLRKLVSVICTCCVSKTLLHFFFSPQVLFLRWTLTMFDLIDCKDKLRAIYGFIFSFVTEENLVRFNFLQSVNSYRGT